MIKPPNGIKAIRQVFGDIKIDRGGNVVSPIGWELANLTTVRDLPGYPNAVRIHRLIEEPLRLVLADWLALGESYKLRSIGGWCVRAKRGNAQEPSVHSWGAAIDINPDTNPRGLPLRYDMPDQLVALFELRGFRAGIHFKTPDPMHFQYCTGY